MYRGFNVTNLNFLLNHQKFYQYKSTGDKFYKNVKDITRPALDKYIINNGTLDAEKMRHDWFPKVKMDIFISHSHADKDLAIALAGILSYFDLKVFVDSCIWGYSDELLKAIDKECCWQEESSTYSYEKRNYSTAHVHMMLANALTHMMDQTECIIFLNTDNSVNVKSGIKNMTYSPWLFHEIAMTKILEEKPGVRQIDENIKLSAGDSVPKIAQPLDLSELIPVDCEQLYDFFVQCQQQNIKSKHVLDKLYIEYSL